MGFVRSSRAFEGRPQLRRAELVQVQLMLETHLCVYLCVVVCMYIWMCVCACSKGAELEHTFS
jgi:hypothetical protein